MTRIALISDIHFGKFSRTAEFSVPGEPIRDENSGGIPLADSLIDLLKTNNVQYLCIAGDLTSIGSPQEFSFCEHAILNIAERVGIPKEKIILGLGNHDVDWKIADIFNQYQTSETDFPDELVKEKYQRIAASAAAINIDSIPMPIPNGPAPFSGVVENKDFVMFILNSGCYCTRNQEVSHGKLDLKQLEWFNAESMKYREDTRWKIVLMHHHPFSYKYPIHSIDISMLEEGPEFLEIAGKNGINLVLHGHRHHPRAETELKNDWHNPITFICAGSVAVNSAHRSSGEIPNTVHIIELSDDVGVLKLENYEFSSSKGWHPLERNCPETPLDAKMELGKLFSTDVINKSIQLLPTAPAVISWGDLDDCLKFMTLGDLNNHVKKHFSSTYNIIGTFPNDVCLIAKKRG